MPHIEELFKTFSCKVSKEDAAEMYYQYKYLNKSFSGICVPYEKKYYGYFTETAYWSKNTCRKVCNAIDEYIKEKSTEQKES